MKTTLTKEQLKKVMGGGDEGDVYNRTIKCTRGQGAYDTCCNLPQDTSGQACCERKHGSSSTFLYVVTGPGNCVDEPVTDIG